MTKLTKYGFILKGLGYKENGEINQMNSDEFQATVVAVSSIDSACEIAKKLVGEGIQLIELCGGFDQKDLDQINSYTNNNVPIGLVSFNKKENDKLMKLLSS